MARNRTLKLLCLVTLLGGCASSLPLRFVASDKSGIILTDVAAVMTVTRPRTEGVVTCSRMSADVSFERTSSLSISTINYGNEGESDTGQEKELQGRTPGLLAMRDALYHSCLLYQSGAITSADLLNITHAIMDRSYDVLETEAKNSQWIFNEQASFVSGSSDEQAFAPVPQATAPVAISSATATTVPAQLAPPSSTVSPDPSPTVSPQNDDFADFN